MPEENELPAKRGVSPADAQRLLARAAELQGERRFALGSSLTLAEVEQAAAEAGIDGACIAQAAQELGLAPASRPVGLRELDRAIAVERAADGELTDAVAARIIDEARGEFATAGQVERSETGLVWTSSAGTARSVTVTATSVNGEIRIRAVQDIADLHRSATFLVGGAGAIVGLLAVAAVFSSPLGLVLQMVLAVVLSIGLGTAFGATLGSRLYRVLLRRWSPPYVESLQRAADRMLAAATETSTP